MVDWGTTGNLGERKLVKEEKSDLSLVAFFGLVILGGHFWRTTVRRMKKR